MLRLSVFLTLMVAGWTLSIQPLLAQERAAAAQDVLVLSQERLLRDSKKGKMILAEEESQKAFEQLAAEFDARVVAIREEDVRAAEVLAAEFEAIRKNFFADVVPIVAQIMTERGASLIFEQRNVLFTGPNVDITDDVIARMDKAAGLD